MKPVYLKFSSLSCFCLIFGLASNSALSSESSDRLNNPFLLPQTSLFLGNVNYLLKTSNAEFSTESDLSDRQINTYGFALEVNYSRFMNIGAYMLIESLSVDTGQDIGRQFAAIFGGFSRFFYVPPFLDGKSFKTSMFTRFDLGGGPFIAGPSGLLAQMGVHFGFETYLSKWLGLSFSYGRVFEYGRETLLSGNSDLTDLTGHKYKDATIWSQGHVFLVAIKTTLF